MRLAIFGAVLLAAAPAAAVAQSIEADAIEAAVVCSATLNDEVSAGRVDIASELG